MLVRNRAVTSVEVTQDKSPRRARALWGVRAGKALLDFGETLCAFRVVDAAPLAYAACTAEGDLLALPVSGGAVGGQSAVGLHGAERVDCAHVGGGLGLARSAAGQSDESECGERDDLLHARSLRVRTRGHDAAGGDNGGDFNPHDVDAKGTDSNVGSAGGVEFGERQATFGADEQRERLIGDVRRRRVGLARGVCDDEAGQGERFSECSGRRDFHQPCAGGLLERLFADAREAGEFGIARIDDAALAHEW